MPIRSEKEVVLKEIKRQEKWQINEALESKR